MKSKNVSFLMLLALLIWAGMVAGISFLEAWLKFQAPYVTLPIGLGIGKLVFGYLNKVEIMWCALLLIGAVYTHPSTKIWRACVAVTAILLLQTFWLLPALDARADQVIAGETVPASFLHLYYVLFELAKVSLLVLNAKLVYNLATETKKQEPVLQRF